MFCILFLSIQCPTVLQIIQQCVQIFQLLHIFVNTWYCLSLILAFLAGVQLYLVEGFNSFFPTKSWYCAPFYLLIGHLISFFFREVPVEVFCPFFNGLFVFFILISSNFLSILENCPLAYKYCFELQESRLKFLTLFPSGNQKRFARTNCHAQKLNGASCCQMLTSLVGVLVRSLPFQREVGARGLYQDFDTR